MFRYRRYRAFIAFAVISVLAFYHFSGLASWGTASVIGAGSLKKDSGIPLTNDQAPQAALPQQPQPGRPDAEPARKQQDEEPVPERPRPQDVLYGALSKASTLLAAEQTAVTSETPDAVTQASIPTGATNHDKPLAQTSTTTYDFKPAVTEAPAIPIAESDPQTQHTSVIKSSSSSQIIYWSKQPEHFPVSSTIQLPSGTPKAIPRIQHVFKEESQDEKTERKLKLRAVKDAAVHAWKGYRENAWTHDEVRPVSGGSKDPFCGWAATLVDALDTLWIMGMKTEFEEAVRAVGKIDFTTSTRRDIPLFETTIRYLGGLLSAYDLSEGRYVTLLDKAVELAEILMGAFDTPNRMPITYYYWMPAFASQPHRASTRIVLAEIGSLSMEFTRLAQITKEPKYYDAVDRITDAFYEWQQKDGVNGTLLPGLFPTYIDASGCGKPAQIPVKEPTIVAGDYADAGMPVQGDPRPGHDSASVSSPMEDMGKTTAWEDSEKDIADSKSIPGDKLDIVAEATKELHDGTHKDTSSFGKRKRQLDGELAEGNLPDADLPATIDDGLPPTIPDAFHEQTKPRVPTLTDTEICVPRGLANSVTYGADSFTIGSMADSAYEYFPKQYLLLGGLETKYRELYERSMDVTIDKLLFRPMTPENHDILFSGEYNVQVTTNSGLKSRQLKPELAHLTCFAGGMFAMGAKIFGREEDLEIGAKLANGCVWAYNVTATGIMPELGLLSVCEDKLNCVWNKTKYYEELDPYRAMREKIYTPPVLPVAEQRAQIDTAPRPPPASAPQLKVDDDAVLKKRQSPGQIYPKVAEEGREAATPAYDTEDDDTPSKTVDEDISYAPPRSPTHEEFVEALLRDERLPLGFTKITDRRYILRPEAIESVFYLHRITGHPHWRRVGWDMFQAVQTYTLAEFGHSAIADVTSKSTRLGDSEESFWLAETLKYFYLLFSDESVISLDEWVFNTEAHPFRRPDAPARKTSTKAEAGVGSAGSAGKVGA